MFDLDAMPGGAVVGVENAARCDDAAVVDALVAATRQENAAAARRLAWMGELYARRAPADDLERANWAVDGHAHLVAEISAALRISRGRAAGQLHYAITLRERLPNVLAVFRTGAIDWRMMAALVTRTDNVTGESIATLDAALARRAPAWMRMSGPALVERIDMWITKYDPDGVRAPRPTRDQRHIGIGPGAPGMASLWGQLPLAEGAALDERPDQLAAAVCRDDPRTTDQRRADALTALAAGLSCLPCQCGAADCPTRDTQNTPLGQVVTHVLADRATVDATSQAPGYLPGYGSVPAAQLRELATTATLKPLLIPAPIAEPRYRPSPALAEFIRWRDLTCRWPGCEEPARACDIDHTIPYPSGPTHPSNLKLYCRHHHLLKTFSTGLRGWTEHQAPDGSLTLTAPTGHTYTTMPAGAAFYPTLAVCTGELPIIGGQGPPNAHRTMMMPTRRRTRANDHPAATHHPTRNRRPSEPVSTSRSRARISCRADRLRPCAPAAAGPPGAAP